MGGGCCVIISQRACVIGNSVGCARIGVCRCQVRLDRSEYRLRELWEGVSSEKYIPRCVGCSSAELGCELCALCESWYTTGRVKREGGRG
jgi:hypothetical protein